MRRIALTQGKYAIVDDEDFARVNELKWHFDRRYVRSKIRGKHVLLHRFLLSPPSGMVTDWLGSFSEPMEAARAYNKGAIKYFGDFARVNAL